MKKKSQIRGAELVDLVRVKLENEQASNLHFARLIGKSYPYAGAILSKRQPIAALGIPTLRVLAQWLEIPLVQVLLLAGEIEASDLVSTSTLDETLNATFQGLKANPQFAGILTEAAWEKASQPLKLAIATLHHEALGKQLGAAR